MHRSEVARLLVDPTKCHQIISKNVHLTFQECLLLALCDHVSSRLKHVLQLVLVE